VIEEQSHGLTLPGAGGNTVNLEMVKVMSG